MLVTRTLEGTVVFERNLGDSKITVSGTDPNFEHGDYPISHTAKRSINNIWLQMIGIYTPHEILGNQKGTKHKLTWRAMLHMFLIKQEDIARTTSVILNPRSPYSDTPSKAVLLFLMTGFDANSIITPENKEIKAAKKEAVAKYIRDMVKRLVAREGELLELRDDLGETDLLNEMNSVVSQIDGIQRQINEAVSKSKKLMESIYDHNGRLSECETIAARFAVLRGQYQSDIERLAFIVEGGAEQSSLSPYDKCPFCDSDFQAHKDTSYIEAVRAELEHIRTHLEELSKAERDINQKREVILEEIRSLEEQRKHIDETIHGELKPYATSLKERLGRYKRAVELEKEIETIQLEERNLSKELAEREAQPDDEVQKFNITEDYERETVSALEDRLISILRSCRYEGYSSARLNMDTFDLEIAGQSKAMSNGGGYCGFLNTIMALAIMEYLSEEGLFAPGILIADSPLSQLSESEHKKSSETMKTSLIQYLKSNQSYGQVIIVEQKEKLPDLDYSDVRLIEFTKEREHGHYGFLTGVFGHR